MFTKTLIAGAALAAAFLAPASASAGGVSVYAGSGMSGSYAVVGTGGWGVGFGYRPYIPPAPPPVKKVCQPVYKTVTVWQPWYGYVRKTVYTGQKCWLQPVYRAW